MRKELAISIVALTVASASFFVAVLSATPALPSTVHLYTPGGAPCAGVCSLEWAAKEFEVPVGVPERMVVPAGTSIVKMSYGKNGKPYWVNDQSVFAEDQPGQGYAVVGTPFWMVQIDACQNWALVVMTNTPGFYMPPAVEPIPVIYTPFTTTKPFNPPTPWEPLCCKPPVEKPPVIINPPVPSAVPLPESFGLLLLALCGLSLGKIRKI